MSPSGFRSSENHLSEFARAQRASVLAFWEHHRYLCSNKVDEACLSEMQINKRKAFYADAYILTRTTADANFNPRSTASALTFRYVSIMSNSMTYWCSIRKTYTY